MLVVFSFQGSNIAQKRSSKSIEKVDSEEDNENEDKDEEEEGDPNSPEDDVRLLYFISPHAHTQKVRLCIYTRFLSFKQTRRDSYYVFIARKFCV